jgi:DNA-binding transcriptional LysR family regulator
MRYALSFRHVEIIHAVVLTGSATGAAGRLHVTQPAVSNMLRDAQERLGFELFERKAGRLVPTPNTLALFEEIERSFTGLDEINGLAERLRRQRGRRVVLACTPVFAAVVLPRMLAALHDDSPDVLFTVHSRSAEHVAALVSSQKADLGFGLTVPPMPGVHSEVLAEVPMVCYLPPGHRLARKRKAVNAADLVGEPMISFSNHEGLDQIVANAFRGCGGPPTAVVECPAALAACAMVAAGIGFAIFDSLPARLLSREHLVVRPFEPHTTVQYRAYWFNTRMLQAERNKLLEQARHTLRSLVGDALVHIPRAAQSKRDSA